MRRQQSCPLRLTTSLWLAAVACAIPPGGFCRRVEQVRPVDWTRYTALMGVRSNDTFGQTIVTVLQNEARYELRWVEAEQTLVTNLPGWEGMECYALRSFVSAGRLDRQVSGHRRSHLPEQRAGVDAMVANARPLDVADRRLMGPSAGWAVIDAERGCGLAVTLGQSRRRLLSCGKTLRAICPTCWLAARGTDSYEAVPRPLAMNWGINCCGDRGCGL